MTGVSTAYRHTSQTSVGSVDTTDITRTNSICKLFTTIVEFHAEGMGEGGGGIEKMVQNRQISREGGEAPHVRVSK